MSLLSIVSITGQVTWECRFTLERSQASAHFINITDKRGCRYPLFAGNRRACGYFDDPGLYPCSRRWYS